MHTQKWNIVRCYLHKIQKQAKLIYHDRSQNSGYFWGGVSTGRGQQGCLLRIFYILVLKGGYLGTYLKFHHANSKIRALSYK